MQNLRRNWPLVSAVMAVVLAGGLWWGLDHSHQALADPEPHGGYDPVTEAQRQGVLGVMDDVGLDRDALVALNLSAVQAEEVLAAGRTWWEQNAGTLETLKATIDTRTVAVRALRAQIRMGPAQGGQDDALAAAIADLLTARQAYRSALSGLRTTLAAEFTETQRTAWASMDKGLGERMPIRLLNLSNEQRLAVSRAWRLYRLRFAAAETNQARAAIRAAWATVLTNTLTQDQRNLVAAYRDYWVDSSEALAEALETVLPMANA